jgi:DNA-binding transcriptional MocR family regulator
VSDAVTARGYKRSIARLSEQLDSARQQAMELLREAGLRPLATPRGGMFVSAALECAPTASHNGRTIAAQALKAGIQLAPGEFFMLGEPSAIWFRFNVAYAADPALLRFLQSIQ